MKEIYDKLNTHEYLNYNDFKKFISIYSKNNINTKFINMENSTAFYNTLTNTIFINKNFRKIKLKSIINFSKEKLKDSKDKEPNFIIDLYNLVSLTTLFHELRHAKQLKTTKNLEKFTTAKLKLIIENYSFMERMPKLYKKNHDLYYFEYDAVIRSLIEMLNIINKCKNLDKNSIIEYNRIMAALIYHSYGNKYIYDNVAKIYDKFSSPISYSTFLANILKDKRKKEDIKTCIKILINESKTEYLKLINGCKLSNETMHLLYDIYAGIHNTLNILDDVKEIDDNLKYKLTR